MTIGSCIGGSQLCCCNSQVYINGQSSVKLKDTAVTHTKWSFKLSAKIQILVQTYHIWNTRGMLHLAGNEQSLTTLQPIHNTVSHLMYEALGTHRYYGLKQIHETASSVTFVWVDSRMDGCTNTFVGGSVVSAGAVLCVLALLRHLVHQLVGAVLDAAAVW